MTGRWMCSCGQPWHDFRHRNLMARLVGVQWRGSPGLMVPYRQWIREKLPNGNQGFVCCGDDGFIRSFASKSDVGELTAVEWKTNGRQLDKATEKTFAAIQCGQIRGTLLITLYDGNVPAALAHYPVPRQIADDDWLPEPEKVASRITVTDWVPFPEVTQVTEPELIAYIKSAAGYVDHAHRSEVA